MRHTMLSVFLLTLAASVGAQEAQQQQPPEDRQSVQQDEYEQTTYEPTSQQQDQQQSGQASTQSASQSSATQTTSSQSGMQSSQSATQSSRAGGSAAGTQQTSTGTGQAADVARAQFTSEVRNREPVDEVSNFEAQSDPLYFFTEVKNAEGQTITHRWLHNGEVMAEVPLDVGSDSWRTWSSKELMPSWEGEWTVEVVDANGNVLEQQRVSVEAPAQTRDASYSPEQQSQQQSGQQSGQQSMQQTGTSQQDQGSQQSGSTSMQQTETTSTGTETDSDQVKLDEGWETESVSVEETAASESESAEDDGGNR